MRLERQQNQAACMKHFVSEDNLFFAVYYEIQNKFIYNILDHLIIFLSPFENKDNVENYISSFWKIAAVEVLRKKNRLVI